MLADSPNYARWNCRPCQDDVLIEELRGTTVNGQSDQSTVSENDIGKSLSGSQPSVKYSRCPRTYKSTHLLHVLARSKGIGIEAW